MTIEPRTHSSPSTSGPGSSTLPFSSSSRASSVGTTRPLRMLDTRPGNDIGRVVGGGERVEAGSITRVQLAGARGLPDDISFATVNLTVVRSLEPGFATIFPCTAEVPNASNINFGADTVTANNAMVALDRDGGLCIYSSAEAHLLIDVTSTR